MEKESIAKNLVYQRKKNGLTQEQLSDRSGVAIRTIQRIESAKVAPHLQTLSLLANSLGLNVQELSLIQVAEEKKNNNVTDIKWLTLLHLLPIIGFIIPFANLIIPLILWIYKREGNIQLEEQGRAVINFHATVVIGYMISVLLLVIFFPVGFPLIILTALYAAILILRNTLRVMNGQSYYYPLSLKFLRV